MPPPPSQVLLEARDLCRDVPTERLRERLVALLWGRPPRHHRRLDRVNLSVLQGELLGVIGPSGCGKSTLLRALRAAGRRPFTSGRVLLGGEDLYGQQARLRSTIAYLPQEDIVHLELTVAQTLHYGARLRGLRLPPEALAERTAWALERVRLTPPPAAGTSARQSLLEQQVATLSGGQRKRLQLAVELMAMPRLLLCDEVTSGLDPELDAEVMALLREVAGSGTAVVCVTHAHRNLHHCDRVVVMSRGRIVFGGAAPEAIAAYEALGDGTGVPPEPRSLRVEDAATAPAPAPPARPGLLEETALLARRHLSILRADRLGLLLLVVQVLAVAVALALVFAGQTGRPGLLARNVSFVLSIAGFWFGFVHAAGEMVRERPLYLRERSLGVRPLAYVASKWLVLLPLAIVPVLLLYLWACLWVTALGGVQTGPAMTLVLVTATGTCSGLALSALLRHPRWMVAGLFVAMMLQIIFSGIFRLPGAGVARWAARVLSAQYWGWEAMIRQLGFTGWERDRSGPGACLLALGCMSLAGALLTWLVARRREP